MNRRKSIRTISRGQDTPETAVGGIWFQPVASGM